MGLHIIRRTIIFCDLVLAQQAALGALIGIALGGLGAFFMTTLYPSLPVRLSAWSVTTAFFFSLSVGIFFGVYPAVKASGVDPVDALRYE